MLQDYVVGDVQSLAFGGQGILKHEGFVIFVPFTASGERVSCQITQRKKNFAHAELLAIERPSPNRITPACPSFGTCGGCQLQHLDYQTQLEHKRQWVENSLKRIGQLELSIPPVVPAQLQWAYRRHISLNLRPMQKGFAAGYIAVDQKSLLPVHQCPIFIPSEDQV